MKTLIAALLLFAVNTSLLAAIEVHDFKDAETEAAYNSLIQELRCLVCQNESLAGSNADLAKDLRKKVYDMLIAGKSRQDVVEYMTNRYGDFVLYNPPLKKSTLLLWIGPFVLLLLVLLLVMMKIKKNRTVEAPPQQSLNQAKDLLSKNGDMK